MKKPLLLIYLLSKRLYKKVSFVAILVALVAVTAVICLAFQQESSIVKIGLVEPAEESSAYELVTSLAESESVVSYEIMGKEEALALLKSGKLDSVWEFENFLDKAIAKYIESRTNTAPIQVYVRENNIFVNLSLERLYAELYPLMAREYYRNYGTKELDVVAVGEYMEFFDNAYRHKGIVQYSYYNNDQNVESENYLVSPLRGILAVILTLCCLASALYFMHDCDNGNMDSTPINKRWGRQVLYTLVGGSNIAVFVLISVGIGGLFISLGHELLTMLLFVLASVGFATTVSGLAGKTVRLASLLPILVIAMLAICPVFLDLEIKYISSIFPVYWYLKAIYNPSEILSLVIYTAITFATSFVLWKNKKYTK